MDQGIDALHAPQAEIEGKIGVGRRAVGIVVAALRSPPRPRSGWSATRSRSGAQRAEPEGAAGEGRIDFGAAPAFIDGGALALAGSVSSQAR